jgi:hypothetical protein
MKANKAPEKIYVADTTFPDYVDFDGSPINTKRIDEHDIEYTCTDAFIEKASKWLRNEIYTFDPRDTEEMIENFKKAMML